MSNRQRILDLTLVLKAALVGEPTGNIRAVVASERDNSINLKFLLFNNPGEDEIESIGYIGSEVQSNYNDRFLSEQYEVISEREIYLSKGEVLIYERS